MAFSHSTGPDRDGLRRGLPPVHWENIAGCMVNVALSAVFFGK
jgi:hypothetical protein